MRVFVLGRLAGGGLDPLLFFLLVGGGLEPVVVFITIGEEDNSDELEETLYNPCFASFGNSYTVVV